MLAIAPVVHGAGTEDRTPIFCLEGSGSTIELHPRVGGRLETRSPHRCRCRILSRERQRLAG